MGKHLKSIWEDNIQFGVQHYIINKIEQRNFGMEKSKTNLMKNLKYSINAIRKFKKFYLVFMLLSIIFALIGKIVSVYTSPIIIDVVEKSLDESAIFITISLLIIFNFSYYCISSVIGHKLRTEYRTKFEYSMKDNIMKKCMYMPYEFLEDPDILTLKDRAYNSAISPFDLLLTACNIISQFLIFAFFGSLLALHSPIFIVYSIVSSVIYMQFLKAARNYQQRQKDKTTKLRRKLNYIKNVSSNFDYAKEVRLFNLHKWLEDLANNFFGDYYSVQKKIEKKNLYAEIFNIISIFIRDLGLYILLINQILNDKITIAQFVLYVSAVFTISGTITSFFANYNRLKMQSLNIDDYVNFISNYNENHGEEILQNDGNGVEIKLVNVSFKYPKSDRYILENVNLTISKGEKLAIVGANGAGKTTLVKLICGFYQPTSGEILMNGIPLKDLADCTENISVVFQTSEFMPLSIAENIGVSDGDNYDLNRVVECLRLSGMLDKVNSLPNGLYTKMCKDICEDATDFSGGEHQRLLLARTIYKNSSLMILDEPTSALDPIAENEIYKKYSELTQHKTSIYISPRLASTQFCDRIAYIEDGKICELGTHEELMMKNGKYSNIYATQSYYYNKDEESDI